MRTKLIVAMVIGIIVAVALFMRGEKNPTTAAVPACARRGPPPGVNRACVRMLTRSGRSSCAAMACSSFFPSKNLGRFGEMPPSVLAVRYQR